jgi:hypothetical protein
MNVSKEILFKKYIMPDNKDRDEYCESVRGALEFTQNFVNK